MQKEILGSGCVAALKEIVDEAGVSSVLLITGKHSYVSSGAKEWTESLLSRVKVTQFSDFSVNPRIEDVLAGVRLLKADDFDLVVAVGGGSVMDIAKLVNVLSHQPEEVVDYVVDKKPLVNQGLPLVAIPTTSGSGSEATKFAVIYIDQVKFSLSHEYLLPSYAIVDPELTYSLPAKSAAASGMDALSQAVESFWSVRSTEESRELAEKAIKMILNALERSLDGDLHAKGQMALAAHLAGKAINMTTTTAPHALSYYLTTYFKIPHGHAVALILGEMLVINAQPTTDNLSPELNYVQYLVQIKTLFLLMGGDCAQACRDQWYNLMRNIGLETSLFQAGGVTREDLSPIVDSVNMERLQNNPVRLSADDLHALLSRLL